MKTRKEIEDKIKDFKKGVEILNKLIGTLNGKETSEGTIKDLIKSKEDILMCIDILNWTLS